MTYPVPDAALGHHTVLLGKTRAGKSSTMRGIVERLLDQAKPVCIIDPKGDWWGLKSSADGKRPGYKVIIFGGEHADVAINAHSGAHVAELISTGNRPCIIDLGGWMVGERTRFFIEFASTLFRNTRGPRHLAIDEVHNFAPQGKIHDPDAGKMLHWANRLASEGAGKGITLLSASQRPQKVHKDYLTSHETLIAMRVIHKLDRDAIADWVRGAPDQALGQEVLATLAVMERGEGWVWCPEANFGPARIKFPMFSTYDSFAAPTTESVEKLKGWASVDLDEVRSKLAVVVEEAKANDPRALKAEVQRLTRELARAEKVKATPPPAPERIVANADQIEAARAEGEAAGYSRGIQAGVDAVAALGGKPAQRAIRRVAGPVSSTSAAPAVHRDPPPTGAPQQRILNAIAWWAAFGIEQPKSEQVAFVSGYSASSSGYANLKGAMRTAGLIDYPAPGRMSLTEAGVAKAEQPTGEVTRDAFHAAVRAKLSGPQLRLLNPLIAVYPESLRSDELAHAADYSTSSSGYANLKGNMRSLGYLDYPSPGQVRAADWLFP